VSGGPRGNIPSDPGLPEKPTLVQRLKASPITTLICAINIAYFIWIERHGSSHDFDVLLRFGAVEKNLVRAGEYWRIASYMVVHIGWAHLLLNTWAGGSWCLAVERMLGPWRFLLLYLLAGIAGGAAVVVFSDAITAGASGAMFGIIGALLVIRYRMIGSWDAFTRDRGVRSTVAQIALWTVLGIVTDLKMSNAGHMGGLVAGTAWTFVITLPNKQRALGRIGYAALFLGFLVFAAAPWKRAEARPRAIVRLDRIGRIACASEAQARAACEKGDEHACVVVLLSELDPKSKEYGDRAAPILDRACKHGDEDACGGLGALTIGGYGPQTEQDLERGMKMLHEACVAGSEWSCELAPSLPIIDPTTAPDGG
jgi:rhomboid protease GluP